MTARSAGAAARDGRAGLAESVVHHPLRLLFAGVALTVAFVNLAVIAYLDLLTADYERYVWLISGPAPFHQFGSGPFQLWFHVAFALAVGGFAVTGIALLLRRRLALVLGLAVGAAGVLAGPATLLQAVL